jgi:AAA+ superfamily predicted ATPase
MSVNQTVRPLSEWLQPLLKELQRIDGLIQAQVQGARQNHSPEDRFRGLCISEAEVDEILASAQGPQLGTRPDAAHTSVASTNVSGRSFDAGSPLAKLVELFSLTAFDVDCLLIALAPELDARYERLYAYLQDDITKRWPTKGLVLNLLCPGIEQKIACRERFQAHAPLIRHKLVEMFEESSHPHSLRIDDRIANFLLGSGQPDVRLQPYMRRLETNTKFAGLILPEDVKRRLTQLAHYRGDSDAVVYLQGPYGSGKRVIAEAICNELQVPLLAVDVKHMAANTEGDWRALVAIAIREAKLQSAALYWSGFECLLSEAKEAWQTALARELNEHHGFSFLGGEAEWQPAGELSRPLFIRVELPRPTYAERVQFWETWLGASHQQGAGELDFPALATKFRFTPGQIRDAAATARNLACQRDPVEGKVGPADVYEACRLQCNRKLADLARKIKPHYAWDDIVLPPDRVGQLREICNSVKYRSVVYDKWGFDRKLSLGKGISILFSGPPGTGKTMAAEIIAAELSLDLYKIDLSSMVSKYIGETEKNLARVFREAETSNAILFFDEADALFGKRSEVRDSHDRYANIEVGYLLQRMEEYEGIVILATNFRRNMDEAFVRRLHCTVDFPFPDEADRRQIWETIWPKETPRHGDVDLDHISRRFEIAGGNIRNIALGAAFLAADNGGAVKMQHLLHATRREYQKMGKVVGNGEFD